MSAMRLKIILLISLTLLLLASAAALGYIDTRPLFGANKVLGPEVLVFLMLFISVPMTFSILKLKQRSRKTKKRIRRQPPPGYDIVAAKLAEIEAELKRIGFWMTEPLTPAQYNFQRPFGGDTMAFNQWLQFILIPRVREIIETRGEFPAQSQIAVYAVRELDGITETERLQSLLFEFDMLFDPTARELLTAMSEVPTAS